MPGIKPPKVGLTPEAAEALNLPPNPRDVGDYADSTGDDTDSIYDVTLGPPLVGEDTGDTVPDADESRSRLRTPLEEPPPPREKAKAGPPTLAEWLDFFSRIFLRVLCDFYINYAFRGVDEDLLSEREVERLRMTDEERQRIAIPLAELSNQSKVMRKHGRMIVASGGAFDAVLAFGVWTARVNRIARKYKPRQPRVRVNERTGQTSSDGEYTTGANGGRVGEGFTIINPNT
jgi:hypothetical protein